MLRDILNPAHRKAVYLAYAVVGVLVGAAQVAYSAGEWGQPDWLTVTLAVYAFLGTALGFTAAGNTPTSPGEVAQAAVEVDATPPPEGYQPRHVDGA